MGWSAPVFLMAALALLAAVVPGRTAPRPPNIVLILTDDQGWPELGVHGNPEIETPNLDRLAAEGTRLSRFYASPVCSPTRAALMTGRYPQRTGAIDTYLGRDTLDARETTLAQVLQRAGYRTGLVGKWHLGRYMRYHPQSRGFHDFFGFWQYGFINRYFDSEELWEGKTPVVTEGYVTDVLTDEAVRFVRRAERQPFFLYLAYNAPHSPLQAPDPLVARYLKKGLPLKDAQVYAMIHSVDQGVGRLLQSLDQGNLREETLVLFMTDNGHTTTRHTAGLRGLKGSVFEGGIRVPLLARWPGRIPAGRVADAPAQHVDLFPTLCEAAGAAVPTDRPVDGRSLLPLLRGESAAPPHRYLYHQWSRVRPSTDQNWAIHDTRDGWKLVNGQLFDLKTDPGEQQDLAARHPERAAELRQEFLRWFGDVTAGQAYARVPIEIGRSDEDPVELDLTWAETRGSVKAHYRHYNRDHTTDWKAPGDALEWRVDVVRPGRYEVELTYGCPADQAGGRFRLRCGPSTLQGTVLPGGRGNVYATRVAGVVPLKAGERTLSLEAVSIPGSMLMELHKVRLRRLPAERTRENGE